MANALYDKGREGFLDGSIDANTAVLKVVLVDTAGLSVDLTTNQFLSAITGANRIATSAALTVLSVAAGVLDLSDVTLTAVSGASVEAIVLYQSSAVTGGADVADTAQRLIAYIDTGTGLPFTPNGGDITIQWDNGANKVFKL